LGRAFGRDTAPAYRRADGAPYVRRSFAITAAIAVILALTWRGECWAYIDPNAGGFLSQILAPFAAIFVSFLFYCRKEIKRFAKSVRNRWKRVESRSAVPGHEAVGRRREDDARETGK